MSFIRHIGKIGDRKVAIIFREIPNEQHMCLVTYTETLNMHVHDPMMQTIESDIGQNSSNLADALNRTYTKDGKIILQVLHSEGLLKKVQTSQVIVTPSSNTRIKLDELNKILDEMQQGEAAVKRLAEIDTNRNEQEITDIAKMMRGDKKVPPVSVPSQVDGILGDNVIVNNLRSQAAKMEAEAKGLLAESQRLQKEASDIEGPMAQSKPDKKKNLVETPTAIIETAKKRGRPAKSTLTA